MKAKKDKVVYRPSYDTIAWGGDRVVMLDQRLLPGQERYLKLRTHTEVIQAIKDLVIRGAPAIGIAAAMGCALGAIRLKTKDPKLFRRGFEKICREMEKARPTAINLAWAVNHMRHLCDDQAWPDVATLKEALVEESQAMLREDVEINLRMGRNGARLIPARSTILTYCNAGTLATGGYGTALGVIRSCAKKGPVQAIACETRPFLQGARLTAWELMKEKIPVTVITDNMVGFLMQQGKIDCAVVGADRVAANGDVANKIGTYTVATLCRVHKIPFYVAAPLSTIDPACPSGAEIPIEYRKGDEVTSVNGKRIAPERCKALYPAFDITPASLVSAIITEKGVARAPYRTNLRKLKG